MHLLSPAPAPGQAGHIALQGGLLTAILRCYAWTLRVRWENDDAHLLATRAGPCICALWHGRMLPLLIPLAMPQHTVLVSLSRDGSLLTDILRRLGYSVVRGSSSRGGSEGRAALLRALEEGHSVMLAVDGPRGPAFHVKPGILKLAALSGRPILPLDIHARGISLNSWDRFFLPYPFSKVTIRRGEPIYVRPEGGIPITPEDVQASIARLRSPIPPGTSLRAGPLLTALATHRTATHPDFLSRCLLLVEWISLAIIVLARHASARHQLFSPGILDRFWSLAEPSTGPASVHSGHNRKEALPRPSPLPIPAGLPPLIADAPPPDLPSRSMPWQPGQSGLPVSPEGPSVSTAAFESELPGQVPNSLDVPSASARSTLWLHGASVGEVRLASRVLQLSLVPNRSVLTAQTARAQEWLLKNPPGARVACRLAPLDLPRTMEAAFSQINPAWIILIETELWPTMLLEAQRRSLPVLVVNGRISRQSLSRYARADWLFLPRLATLHVFARTELDAARFQALGVSPSRTMVMGDLKLLPPPPQVGHLPTWLERWLSAGPLLVGASLHPPEDELLLQTFRRLTPKVPGLRLLLAPRHRAALSPTLRASGIQRRSAWSDADTDDTARTPDADVLLLDSLGELEACYHYATIACMGGTFWRPEGHNLLEPILRGCPVVFGPHGAEVDHHQQLALRAGAVIQVGDAETLLLELASALTSPSRLDTLVEGCGRVKEESLRLEMRFSQHLNGWLAENGR